MLEVALIAAGLDLLVTGATGYYPMYQKPRPEVVARRRMTGPRGQRSHAHDVDEQHQHGGHAWMMIARCIPMLLIAVILAATGIASAGFLVGALACTAMMALMMSGMGQQRQTLELGSRLARLVLHRSATTAGSNVLICRLRCADWRR